MAVAKSLPHLFALLWLLCSAAIAHTRPATFYNDAVHTGADPYTLYDDRSGLYYTYSTSGQDPGWLFAIYTSPDLSTWKRLPGGAMQACINNGTSFQTGQMCWARDWQWAPEVYHNARTGWYFLFFAGRLREDLGKDYFQYSKYEEATKIGVAVSKSPAGPFQEIEPQPIDYYPYDPDYRDVNLIMDSTQKLPPLSPKEARGVYRGTYISAIDPNLYISPNAEHIYLFISRTAYRNWVWDAQLEKYVEESNILGVELSTDWWNDEEAKTMPRPIDAEVDRFADRATPLPHNITSFNGTGQIGYPPRKDGWTAIITYHADPQTWENAGVNDYERTNGTNKDRRWAEGSTLISRSRPDGQFIYLLTYSANDYTSESYGVGFATAHHPLGPFNKSRENPILSEMFSAGTSTLSTGHGSIVATRTDRSRQSKSTHFTVQPPGQSVAAMTPYQQDTQRVMYETPAGSELFYVHHARNNSEADRALYSTRLTLQLEAQKGGSSRMKMNLTAADQALPKGTAPIKMHVSGHGSMTCAGRNILVELAVQSASGAAFELAEASNRVILRGKEGLDVEPLYSTALEDGRTSLLLFRTESVMNTSAAHVYYQRKSSRGGWNDVVGSPVACSTMPV